MTRFTPALLAFVTLIIVSAAASLTANAETRLVMLEEPGCIWCETWKEEVGVVYSKTAAGKAAPLLLMDIYDPTPKGMKFDSAAHYTPTFILMKDGVEKGRIIGYPGESFFWGLLEQMLVELDELPPQS